MKDELSIVNDAALREFIYLSSGKQLPADQKISLNDLNVPITESLISRLAVLSLATLAYRARRGCFKSSAYLTDRCLGACDRPFREAVQEMPLDEAKEQLIQEFCGSLNINRKLASDMVEKMLEQEELVKI